MPTVAGSFEIYAAGGTQGNVMRQVVPEKPICWSGDFAPYSIIGDNTWSDTVVSAEVLIEVCRLYGGPHEPCMSNLE